MHYGRPSTIEDSERRAQMASELAGYSAEERKVAQLVVSAAREAAELVPQGVRTALILKVIKAKLGEKQYIKVAQRFGWMKKKMNKTMAKDWFLRHCDDLRENESGQICTTKQRTSTDEEVLRGLVQLQLTIKPDRSVNALLNMVKEEAKSLFGDEDLKNQFLAWMEVNFSELGFKVKQCTRDCLGMPFVITHREQYLGV